MLVLHVRHAFLNNSLPYSSKPQLEMTNFKILTTTWTNYNESFSLTLYFKSVLTNPVIGHFAHTVQYKQDGIVIRGFLKTFCSKTIGIRKRRFDRSTVIIKQSEDKNLHKYYIYIYSRTKK